MSLPFPLLHFCKVVLWEMANSYLYFVAYSSLSGVSCNCFTYEHSICLARNLLTKPDNGTASLNQTTLPFFGVARVMSYLWDPSTAGSIIPGQLLGVVGGWQSNLYGRNTLANGLRGRLVDLLHAQGKSRQCMDNLMKKWCWMKDHTFF